MSGRPFTSALRNDSLTLSADVLIFYFSLFFFFAHINFSSTCVSVLCVIIVQLADLTSAARAAEAVNKSGEAKASPESCQTGSVATETAPCAPQVQ